jgi:hypothetical protein
MSQIMPHAFPRSQESRPDGRNVRPTRLDLYQLGGIIPFGMFGANGFPIPVCATLPETGRVSSRARA